MNQLSDFFIDFIEQLQTKSESTWFVDHPEAWETASSEMQKMFQ